jgi:hypothetical protein
VEVGSFGQPTGEGCVGRRNECVDGGGDEFGVTARLGQHDAQQVGLVVQFGLGVAGQDGQFGVQVARPVKIRRMSRNASRRDRCRAIPTSSKACSVGKWW